MFESGWCTRLWTTESALESLRRHALECVRAYPIVRIEVSGNSRLEIRVQNRGRVSAGAGAGLQQPWTRAAAFPGGKKEESEKKEKENGIQKKLAGARQYAPGSAQPQFAVRSLQLGRFQPDVDDRSFERTRARVLWLFRTRSIFTRLVTSLDHSQKPNGILKHCRRARQRQTTGGVGIQRTFNGRFWNSTKIQRKFNVETRDASPRSRTSRCARSMKRAVSRLVRNTHHSSPKTRQIQTRGEAQAPVIFAQDEAQTRAAEAGKSASRDFFFLRFGFFFS